MIEVDVRKLINARDRFVDDMIQGILAAHPDQLAAVGNDPGCLVCAGAVLRMIGCGNESA